LSEVVDAIGVLLQGIISLFILDKLNGIKWNNERSFYAKIICLSINMLIWLLVKKSGNWWYMLGIISDMVECCAYLMVLKRQRFLTMFSMVMGSDIIQAFCGLIIAIVFSMVFYNLELDGRYYIPILFFGYLLRFLPLFFVYILNRNFKITRIFEQQRGRWAIIIVGIMFQFSRLFTHIEDLKIGLAHISITILIIGYILGTLWVIDWYFNEREKKLLYEDNKQMAQRLHKAKEIMPALYATLERLKADKETPEFQNVLEEVHQLCQEQMDESEIDDMQCKCLSMTGIHVLDELLQLFEKEAFRKKINFDVFISISMSDVLKKNRIRELDFLRLIGDLMRNAFRAIEKKENQKGNILLAIGCIDEVLQIDIYDNGIPFPVHILNEFGRRGNTEGGTGHGISDIQNLIEAYCATYKLEEYVENAGFTKGISIIWDRHNRRIIESDRRSEISEDSILLFDK